ncbi:hypothetical protein COO60DRAFT_564238 [Scenedesmus sp. NREL 46B-D3]|nr:hypothetical protein COO60DRAFT_564238 [Scenedesmus sp. NREL 46B-D3]
MAQCVTSARACRGCAGGVCAMVVGRPPASYTRRSACSISATPVHGGDQQARQYRMSWRQMREWTVQARANLPSSCRTHPNPCKEFICNENTGRCNIVVDKKDDTTCPGGQCQSGICRPAIKCPLECPPHPNACKDRDCDPATGKCNVVEDKPDNTPCPSGANGTCQLGICRPECPDKCPAHPNTCKERQCNSTLGRCNIVVDKPDNSTCRRGPSGPQGICQLGICRPECPDKCPAHQTQSPARFSDPRLTARTARSSCWTTPCAMTGAAAPPMTCARQAFAPARLSPAPPALAASSSVSSLCVMRKPGAAWTCRRQTAPTARTTRCAPPMTRARLGSARARPWCAARMATPARRSSATPSLVRECSCSIARIASAMAALHCCGTKTARVHQRRLILWLAKLEHWLDARTYTCTLHA